MLTELTDFWHGLLYIFCNIFSLIKVCKRFIACVKKTLFTPFCDFYLLTFADKAGLKEVCNGSSIGKLGDNFAPCFTFQESRQKINIFINFSILELKSFVSIKGYDYQLYRILKHFMVIITFQFWWWQHCGLVS